MIELKFNVNNGNGNVTHIHTEIHKCNQIIFALEKRR